MASWEATEATGDQHITLESTQGATEEQTMENKNLIFNEIVIYIDKFLLVLSRVHHMDLISCAS